ncbi:MAG: CoA-binding protein [Acidobacteriota bacterium]|nr:MAG: CoA-binding protein [Acidobacteriota bacterium]
MTEKCEIPLKNAPPEEIRRILKDAKVIAVVGLSDKPERDSHRVAAYLQKRGYRVIPVNLNAEEILGERAYANLREVPEKIDIVDIFRKPDAVPAVVDEAIAVGAGTVWMQEGIAHNASAEKARAAGLRVVQSKCIMREHGAAFG